MKTIQNVIKNLNKVTQNFVSLCESDSIGFNLSKTLIDIYLI